MHPYYVAYFGHHHAFYILFAPQRSLQLNLLQIPFANIAFEAPTSMPGPLITQLWRLSIPVSFQMRP